MTMKLEGIPFQTTDWSGVERTTHPGELGVATWRTKEVGNVRVRMVDYSPGYVADHWCERGHVVLVLEGELVTELRDGHDGRGGEHAVEIRRRGVFVRDIVRGVRAIGGDVALRGPGTGRRGRVNSAARAIRSFLLWAFDGDEPRAFLTSATP